MNKKMTAECSALFQTLPAKLKELAEKGDKAGSDRLLKSIRDNILSTGPEGLATTAEFMKKNVIARGFDIVNEWRLGAMLLSGKTQSISVIGAQTMAWVHTLEETIGAVAGRWLGKLSPEEAAKVANAAKAQAGELFNHQRNLREWVKAYGGKNGDHIWGSDSRIEATMANSAAGREALRRLNEGKDNLLTSALGVLGKVNQFAGNLLNRGDTHSKLMVGRSKHVGQMYAHFISQGMDADLAMRSAVDQADRMLASRATMKQNLLTARTLMKNGQELPEELKNLMGDLNITKDTDIEATLDAMDAGRTAGQTVTATGDIRRANPNAVPGDGSLKPNQIDIAGRAIQGWSGQSAVVRFILPFVKTPTNIASETWERTMGMALGSAESVFRKLKGGEESALADATFNFARRLESPDYRVRAKAAGELALAVPVAAGVIYMASARDEDSGLPRITGTGPKNRGTRKMWEAAGWQPRSIMVGGTYVSYDRLDPVAGAMFGFMADMTDAVNFSSDESVAEMSGDIGMGLVTAIAANITSKTWMTGVRQLVDITLGTGEEAAVALRKQAGSFVPSVGRDVAQLFDREIKDLSNASDAILAKVPYFSKKVDVRRNFLGEEVSYRESPGGKIWNTLMPFNTSTVKDGVLANEFSNYTQGISLPSTKVGGIDLKDDVYDVDNQSAYDRMLEISSTTKIGGRDLRQALRGLFSTEYYQNLDTEDIDGESNPRILAARKVVKRYRTKARNQVIREIPALGRDISARKQARRQRRAGLGFDFYKQ